jgi:hypothetical protein
MEDRFADRRGLLPLVAERFEPPILLPLHDLESVDRREQLPNASMKSCRKPEQESPFRPG